MAAEAVADGGTALAVADAACAASLVMASNAATMRCARLGRVVISGSRNSIGFSVPFGPLPSPNMSATNTT